MSNLGTSAGSGRPVLALLATIVAILSTSLLVSSMPGAALPTTPISSPSSPYNSVPVTTNGVVPPLVMLMLSRDEQLSIKAYTDYTDLDGDGIIDTTYKDNFAYGGYFDTTLCYSYASNQFKASGAISGGLNTNGVPKHQCSGAWAGNFLNWLTMTRMDIVRYTLFGGKRAVDTTSQTVLQRAFLPDDVHSFQKVYTGSDINLYTPYTSAPMSFCNTSDLDSFYSYYALSPDGAVVGYHPLLRVAKGLFPEWASTEERQCDWGDSILTSQSYADSGTQNSDQPLSTSSGSTELQVFVDVCDNPSYRESFCRPYTSGGTTSYKPAGLLQQYGESGQIRFGLITGTYDHPRTGGAVRRNIGLIAGNGTPGCATGDEINLQTGQFCIQSRNSEGIINNINRLQVSQWPDAPGGYYQQGTSYYDCNNPTGPITNRNSSVGAGLKGSPSTDSTAYYTACSDWHNPLAEMYAEALRYIEGAGNQATSGFAPASNGVDYSMGLSTSVTWSDPYSSANYCASCSIVVLSTGFGSFDSDEIPNNGTIPNLGESAAAATTRLGTIENGLVGNIIGSDIIGYYGQTPTQTGNTDVTTQSTGLTSGTATCSAKSVADFSLVRGVCPQQPNFEGSYYLAGLAFDAWTNNLRPDLKQSDGTAYPGIRNVKTYAVSLAETLPTLNIPAGSGNIVISPLCENYGFQATPTSKGYGNAVLPDTTQRTPNNNLNGVSTCSIDDALILPQTATATTAPFAGVTFGLPTVTNSDGTSTGSLVVVYDDSPWGHDHDRDVIEMITYCSGAACKGSGICQDKIFSNQAGTALIASGGTPRNACMGITGVGSDGSGVGTGQVLVRTEMISASTGNGIVAGFNINGTSADGAYATANHSASGSDTSSVLTGQGVPYTPSNQLGLGTAPVVVEFSATSSTSNTLQNPLFYAAKYGGFSYTAGTASPTPSTVASWDQVNNTTGLNGADGLPDNYFPVKNPAQLSTQLGKVFSAILARAGSGTAAAVVGADRNGLGVVYKATYENQHFDAANPNLSATWIGNLQALFIDSQGRLREDGNADGILESSLAIDPVVTIAYDKTQSTTVLTRDSGSGPVSAPLSTLKPLWDARKSLASLTSTSTQTQRSYTAPANTGRYIFTFMDYNQNGTVDANEQIDFVSCSSCTSGIATSGSSNWGMLNVNSASAASDLINYVRGADTTIGGQASRNRTILYSTTDTAAQTQRLGDIVNATPAAVSAPSESFDLLYNDASYGTYYSQYRNRRSVVYVGANDGMLHAFNGGFYDPSTQKFGLSNNGGSEVQHPLGSELWAYIPYNLLPHLTWMTDPSYAHVWYVDGQPRVFDAKIFAADATHPGGWGTVLVTGFRFGGGPLTLTAPDNNALGKFGVTQSGTTKTLATRSAYVVMDITNPEAAPKVIAELSGATSADGTLGSLGYTTGYPTVAAFGDATGATSGKWYLVFGTGPTDYNVGTSTNNAGLYVYDLGSNGVVGGFVTGYKPLALPGATNSFTGDPVTVDWNLDYLADSLYIGTIGTTGTSSAITAETGQLYKIAFKNLSTPGSWVAPTASIVNPGNPVISTPSVTQDEFGRHWVFAGTGRFFAQADKTTTFQQSLFGFIDTLDSTATPQPAAPSYSSFIDVTNAVVTTDGNIAGVSGSTTQTALISNVVTAGGWKLSLAGGSGAIAERNITATSLLGSTLFATGFTPSGSACLGDGTSELFGLYYKTGAPRADAPVFGTTIVGGNKTTTLVRTVDLGTGVGAAPSLRVNASGSSSPLTIYTQTSSGAINVTNANVGNTVRSGEVDWRESHPTYKQ